MNTGTVPKHSKKLHCLATKKSKIRIPDHDFLIKSFSSRLGTLTIRESSKEKNGQKLKETFLMPYVTRAHIHTSLKHLKSSVVELNKNAFSDPVADMETDLDQALK